MSPIFFCSLFLFFKIDPFCVTKIWPFWGTILLKFQIVGYTIWTNQANQMPNLVCILEKKTFRSTLAVWGFLDVVPFAWVANQATLFDGPHTVRTTWFAQHPIFNGILLHQGPSYFEISFWHLQAKSLSWGKMFCFTISQILTKLLFFPQVTLLLGCFWKKRK